MDLHAVSVELDLMQPARARRHLVDRRRQLRFDEAGPRRFVRCRSFPKSFEYGESISQSGECVKGQAKIRQKSP
jgi:hypothetical protein